MAKFQPKKLFTGLQEKKPDEEGDNGEGLPTPAILRARARRFAGIKEARDALAILPAPGESLHAICTARMDLTDLINVMVEKLGTVRKMRIATLGYNAKNLRAMLRWFDENTVQQISLLTSKMHRAHKRPLYLESLEEFRLRAQRIAAADSHAKIVTIELAHGKGKWWIEGSANLCGNGSGREQVMICHGADGHDFHAAWIDEFITRHEGADRNIVSADELG